MSSNEQRTDGAIAPPSRTRYQRTSQRVPARVSPPVHRRSRIPRDVRSGHCPLPEGASEVERGPKRDGFGSHRSAVRSVVRSARDGIVEPPAEWAQPVTDHARLKTLEYAALILLFETDLAPHLPALVTDLSPRNGERLTLPELLSGIGAWISGTVLDAYGRSVNRNLIASCAEERSTDPIYQVRNGTIHPIPQTLEEASFSAGKILAQCAVVNAYVLRALDQQDGRSRADFVAAVRRSLALPQAMPTMAFEWNIPAFRGLQAQAGELAAGRVDRDLWEYDGRNDRVRPRVHPADWPVVTDDGCGLVRDLPVRGVRYGCPITFLPALIRDLYGGIVDLLEVHGAWPDDLVT